MKSFLIDPMHHVARYLQRNSGPNPHFNIVICNPESLAVASASGISMVSLLQKYADFIPEMFRFIVMGSHHSVASFEAHASCAVVRLEDGMPAFSSFVSDIKAHAARKLIALDGAADASRKDELTKFAAHVVEMGKNSFEYVVRVLDVLEQQPTPLDISQASRMLPDGQVGALRNLLVSRYINSTTHEPSAEFEQIRPVLEVLSAAQDELRTEDLVDILAFSERSVTRTK